MNGHRHVGQHRLGASGRDDDMAGAVLQRIADMPEMPLHFLRLHLQVRNRGAELRVPVDEALVAIEQALVVKLDEHLDEGGGNALVHREALVRPVARRAQAAALPGRSEAPTSELPSLMRTSYAVFCL